MYAVIKTGGKQYRVEQGEQLEVELVGADDGAELELTPVLLVDGDTVLATRNQLEHAVVTARVVGATRGPKIDGFIYKPKSNNRRRYGHRQDLSVLEITAINKGRAASASEPETVEPETVEPETVAPETVAPETAEPETAEED
jgi:large subunit ribosomal protein L21